MKVVCRLTAGFPELARACAGLDGAILVAPEDAQDFAREIGDAAALVVHNARYSAEIATIVNGRARRLRWIQLATQGSDALSRHGIPPGAVVTNAADVWTPAVAEHTLALLLGLVRRLPQLERNRARAEWLKEETIASLSCLRGKTLLVLGAGNIGGEVARKAKAFGMRAIGVARTARSKRPFASVVPVERLAEVLPLADALVVALPLTEKTRRLVGARELGLLKPEAVLVNVARGGIVDERALVAALATGRLAGAGLDVFEQEPPPSDHPLWRLPNVILSPHVAGYGDPEVLERLARLVRDNVARYLAGKPLRHRIELA